MGSSLVLAGQLQQLLLTALSDGSTYSALVPWILDSDRKGLQLSQFAQERQCLEHLQLQAGHARPRDMQQCVLRMAGQCCQLAAVLQNDTCTPVTPADAPCASASTPAPDTQQHRLQSNSSGRPQQQGSRQHVPSSSKGGSSCSLTQPASRLAKLHGHLLCHLAAPDLVGQLQQLLLLLTAGPLDACAGGTSSSSSGAGGNSSKCSAGKQHSKGKRPSEDRAAAATAASAAHDADQQGCQLQVVAGSLQPPLLPCRACAARYAGKALECCGKLLAVMPLEVLQALIRSPHLQQYSPALASSLSKAWAAAAAAAGAGPPGSAHSTPSAPRTAAAHHATPWQQQQQQQQQHGDAHQLLDGCTPAPNSSRALAAAAAGVPHSWTPASAPALFGSTGAAGGPRLADTPSSSFPNGGSSSSGIRGKTVSTHRTPTAAGRLSGLGLLLPTAPLGSGLPPSRPASAGQLPGGGRAAKTAAVCNREKSRDMFFSILRRASSRLDALRAAQEAAAADAAAAAAADGAGSTGTGSSGCQQSSAFADAAAAAAAVTAGLAELLAEVSVSAKQLLLQLAPSNLAYLAELFMACVLQAASTGEPLLEPALLLMAEKDPGRFLKLQQRLADRTAGPGPVGPASAASSAASSPRGYTTTGQQQQAGTTPGSRGGSSQARGTGGASRQGAQHNGSRLTGPGQQQGGQGSSGSAGGRADGTTALQHRQVRSHARSSQQQQHRLMPQAASGVAALQPQSVAGQSTQQGPHSHAGPRPAPRRLAPQPSNHQQQPSGAQAGAAASAAASGAALGASSPLPAALLGAADSPLPASCLSPLFAAASGTPVPTTSQTCDGAAGPTAGAAASGGAGVASPCRRGSSSSTATGSHVAAAVAHAQAEQHTTATAPRTAIALRKLSSAAATASGPHSAPPKLQAGLLSSSTSSSTPGLSAAAAAALAQAGSGPAQVLLQVLPLLPPGQHVLLLLLHAADSSSFNRALLRVMSSRVQQLLSGSPGSFTAASGLGQQAAAVAALGSYCSYLCFAAGATQAPAPAAAAVAPAATQPAGGLGPLPEGPGAGAAVMLQQQPLLDIAALLQQLLRSSAGDHSNSSSIGDGQQQQQHGSSSCCCELDWAWRLALAVPFAVSFMQLADLNTAAAGSPSVAAALSVFQSIRQLPALDPTSTGFGALPACIGCCIQSCHLLQQQQQQRQWAVSLQDCSTSTVGKRGDKGCSDVSKALAAGSCLVDSSYWAICCPGLQQLVGILDAASAAAIAAAAAASTPTGPSPRQSCGGSRARTRQQQQQLASGGTGDKTGPLNTPGQASPSTADQAAAAAGATAGASTADLSPNTAQDAVGSNSTAAAPAEVPAASGPSSTAAADSTSNRPACGSDSSSPANTAASTRYTTPLLLAPRTPMPEVGPPPDSVVAALSAVSDPVRQRLQQAFINQYSTDDNPVKMRDVLTVINGILFANSLAKGLSTGVPCVLQKHLGLLQQAVQQQLAPGAAGQPGGASTQLQGQELARAVHALYVSQLSAALPEALDAAMVAAADHACTAAAAACGALLPADMPPAAASTAAALVTASCKASCAQRLMQEVPVLVQSTLADAADDLVRLINRQWAVHTRMTAAAGAAPAGATLSAAAAGGLGLGTRGSSSNSSSNGASAEAGRQPARVQPVKLEAAAQVSHALLVTPEAAAAPPAAEGMRRTAAPAAAASPAGTTGATTGAAAAVAGGSESSSGSSGSKNSSGSSKDRPAALPGSIGEVVSSLGRQSHAATGKEKAVEPDTAQAGQHLSSDTAATAASPAAIVSSFAAASLAQLQKQPSQQQCLDQLPAPAVLLEVTAAAESAAQQLVRGVLSGRCTMAAVEAELMQALQMKQQEHHVCAQPGTEVAAAAAASPGNNAAALQQQLRQHLVLLLSAALIKTLLSCTELKAAVWGVASTGAAAAAADPQACHVVQEHGQQCQQCQQGQQGKSEVCMCRAEGLPHLTRLPAVLMKACRAPGVPVWLLRQLRQWLQAATLWCQRAEGDWAL